MNKVLIVLLSLIPATALAHSTGFVHAHPHGLEAIAALLAVVVGLATAFILHQRGR